MAIIGETRGKNFTFEFGSEQREALKIFHGVQQRIGPAAAYRHALPSRRQSRERALFQTRQALPANLLQHFRIAPLAVRAARTEFAFEQFAEPVQRM